MTISYLMGISSLTQNKQPANSYLKNKPFSQPPSQTFGGDILAFQNKKFIGRITSNPFKIQFGDTKQATLEKQKQAEASVLQIYNIRINGYFQNATQKTAEGIIDDIHKQLCDTNELLRQRRILPPTKLMVAKRLYELTTDKAYIAGFYKLDLEPMFEVDRDALKANKISPSELVKYYIDDMHKDESLASLGQQLPPTPGLIAQLLYEISDDERFQELASADIRPILEVDYSKCSAAVTLQTLIQELMVLNPDYKASELLNVLEDSRIDAIENALIEFKNEMGQELDKSIIRQWIEANKNNPPPQNISGLAMDIYFLEQLKISTLTIGERARESGLEQTGTDSQDENLQLGVEGLDQLHAGDDPIDLDKLLKETLEELLPQADPLLTIKPKTSLRDFARQMYYSKDLKTPRIGTVKIARILNHHTDPYIKSLVQKFITEKGHPIYESNVGYWVKDLPSLYDSKDLKAIIRKLYSPSDPEKRRMGIDEIISTLHASEDPDVKKAVDEYERNFTLDRGTIHRFTRGLPRIQRPKAPEELKELARNLYLPEDKSRLRLGSTAITRLLNDSQVPSIRKLVGRMGGSVTRNNVSAWVLGLPPLPYWTELKQLAEEMYSSKGENLGVGEIVRRLNNSSDPAIQRQARLFQLQNGHPIARTNVTKWVEHLPSHTNPKAPKEIIELVWELQTGSGLKVEGIIERLATSQDPYVQRLIEATGGVESLIPQRIYGWLSRKRKLVKQST